MRNINGLDKIGRTAVVVLGIGLAAFAAGLLFGYYGSENRPAAGHKVEIQDICGTGAALTVTPEITVTAPGPQMMLDEVVVVASSPRMMHEVVAVATRPGAERVN